MSPAGNADRLRVHITGKRWPSGAAVLGEIGFAITPGEVVALSGPSGCGKSTLLSIIAGLDHKFEGEVVWNGRPRLGVVFQSPRLLPWRTAAENVALGDGGDSSANIRARAALAEMGLAEIADCYPSRLSLGMARRVALARALMAEPELLLLDEAFVSLDPASAEKMRATVLDLVARRGMSVLMVSHDLRESAAMADRQLTLGGTPTRLLLRPEPAPTLAPDRRESSRP